MLSLLTLVSGSRELSRTEKASSGNSRANTGSNSAVAAEVGSSQTQQSVVSAGPGFRHSPGD